MAEVFTWPVSYGTGKKVHAAVKRVRFGDGYEQRRADGINNVRETWSVVMRNERSVVDPAETFLRARKGVEAFDWTPPGYVSPIRVVCDPENDLSVSYPEYNKGELSATFYQVFEP